VSLCHCVFLRAVHGSNMALSSNRCDTSICLAALGISSGESWGKQTPLARGRKKKCQLLDLSCWAVLLPNDAATWDRVMHWWTELSCACVPIG
jgi:hypothetical protein